MLQLRPGYRTVLALRYGQSLSYQEMAKVLDWSLSRVKVTLHRARFAFREAYVESGEEQT
jgi:RNA polymerase sigma-70 factor (ECF subfamily)